MVGVIPARRGSKRVKNKNMAKVGGMTLIERAIVQAKRTKLFSDIYVSSDWNAVLSEAERCGATPISRPEHISGDRSGDIQWLKHFKKAVGIDGDVPICILRPTSPFRTAATIQHAADLFNRAWIDYSASGLKSISAIPYYPEKMWRSGWAYPIVEPDFMFIAPIIARGAKYEKQSSTFEPAYVQNGCIDIILPRNIESGRYMGDLVVGLEINGIEALNIDTPDDLARAQGIANAADALGWKIRDIDRAIRKGIIR